MNLLTTGAQGSTCQSALTAMKQTGVSIFSLKRAQWQLGLKRAPAPGEGQPTRWEGA